MSYFEDDYLMISGIQHYVFCRRQWALIHIEQQWCENWRTVDGNILHRNVHDSGFNEKRGSIITVRAMAVSSPRLGICGECDAVEFTKNPNGVEISGREGKFAVAPIEYKRGEPKENLCDEMQLAAQAMCLEEMLCCEIPVGYLYYGEIHRRVCVDFSDELRAKTEEAIFDMHRMFERRYTPKVKRTKSCNACSLKNICLPVICGISASDYIRENLSEDKIV